MATFTAARAASDFPVFQSHAAGLACVAEGTITIAVNPIAADIYAMCKVPAGAVIVDGFVRAINHDTNATEMLDMDVGWLANDDEILDVDGFGNYGVWVADALTGYLPEGGIYYPLGGVLITAGPKTFTAETTIAVTCGVTAATFVAGPMTVAVRYYVP